MPLPSSTTKIILAASLLVASVATVLAAAPQVANFARWQTEPWENVPEPRLKQPGKWTQETDHIRAGEPATGALNLLYRPVTNADVTVESRLAFVGESQPTLLLRAQHIKGITGDTYLVTLHKQGITLWRRVDGRVSQIAKAPFAAVENKVYRVRAAAEGWRLRVWVDEVLQIDAVDATIPMAGRVGLRAGEGLCRFYDFAVETKPVPPAGVEPATWQVGSNSVLNINQVKLLFLKTPLVEAGRPVAAIVTPPGYRELAETLQTSIRKLTGAVVPIVADADLADAQGRWNDAGLARRAESLVVLGHLGTNRLLPLLYARLYTAVDAVYPGPGGYALHTIHDPWGNGHNVMVVGGSDDAGVRAAGDALLAELAKLPAGANVALPRLLQLKLAPEVGKAVGAVEKNPDEPTIARAVEKAREAFARGQHTGVTRDLTRVGFNYARTGQDGYAEMFKRLARLMIEIYRSKPTTYGGPWGMDADFNSMQIMAAWDLVEESPVFTDAERLEVTRIIAEYAAYVGGFGNSLDALRPGIRHNHNTHPCIGLLFAADYFGKYYHVAEAAHWRTIADACFQAQALSFKPQEDSNGYQWLTIEHMLRYALARPDHTYFANGNARRTLDLAVGTMDNIGWQSTFGDVGGFRGWENEIELWSVGAWYFGEPTYRWAIEKETPQIRRATVNVAEYDTKQPVAREPSRFAGARVFPIERRFYDYWAPKATTGGDKLWLAPVEQAYEKISFRDSFDPQSPYLLLDGIGTGGHRHFDGNAIIRYTDRGREWFADGDYIQALPKFHTSVLVFRNGQSSTLPPFCALEAHADLPSAGMVRSTVREYGGADWSRNLIKLRSGGFVAIDSLKVRTADEYSFRTVWHTLGEPSIAGNRFTSEQHGERFVLDNLDGAQLKLTDDAALGENWKGYTNAKPIVRILQQVAGSTMKAGESHHFLNVFAAAASANEHPVQATRASDSSVLVTVDGETTLVGVTAGKQVTIAPGIETDAAIFALRPHGFSLANATVLVADGRSLLRTDTPVNVEFDSLTGRAVVQSPARITVALAGQDTVTAAPRRQEITLAGASKTALLKLPSPAPAARTTRGAVARVPALPERWTFPGTFTCIAVADLDGDKKAETITGGANGRVCCIGADGKQRWSFKTSKAIKAVWAGDLGVVVGSADGSAYLLDATGKKIWAHAFPYYKRDPIVSVVFAADLDGDGQQEIICGTESWHFYALDRHGKELWHYEGIHASTCGTAVDLDGDGKQEVIAGTEYYTWHAIAPDGKRRWNYRASNGPHANCVAAGDLNGDGKPEVIFGGADGNLHALNAAGKRLWMFNTGYEVTGVAVTGGQIFATSMNFNLYALDRTGKNLWRRDCGDIVRDLIVVGSADKTAIVVASDNGRVALYRRDGQLLSETTVSCPAIQLAAADLDGNGQQTFLVLAAKRGIVAIGPPAEK